MPGDLRLCHARSGGAGAVVTVAIPTYNPGAYLREAVESVLSQTFSQWELVISDDSSTDGGVDFTRDLAQRDPRVRYIRNNPRLGLVGNFSRCARLGSGRYVTIFHQDDVMLPTNLAQKVAVLDANSQVGMIHSNVELVDGSGNVFAYHWHPGFTRSAILTGMQFIHHLIADGNVVYASSVMARRSVLREAGDFDPRLPWTCDWDMWIRIGLCHHVAVIGCPLVRWRVHGRQESNKFHNSLRGLRQIALLYKIFFEERARSLRANRDMQTAAVLSLKRHGFGFAAAARQQGRRLEALKIAGYTAISCRSHLLRGTSAGPKQPLEFIRTVTRWLRS